VATFARDHEGLALSGSLEHASIIGKSKSKSPVRRAPAFRRRATVKCSNGESGILLLQLGAVRGSHGHRNGSHQARTTIAFC
jgi:hypothetical protein